MTTILLVEDNEELQDLMVARLKRNGYQVLTASDGAQGVDVAQAERPALILMDMSLPVLDGWAATRQLQGISETASIPIIALTAHAMVGDREKCLEAGCRDYETKPVDFKRLLAKIQTFLKEQP